MNAFPLMSRTRTPLLALACALLLAAPLTAAAAAAPAKARRATAPGKASAKKPARAATPAEPVTASSRRLEDVRIEGELEVPRITFITVRQPHRFNDFTRATSVRSSRDLAAETALPAWITPSQITSSASQKARKESPK